MLNELRMEKEYTKGLIIEDEKSLAERKINIDLLDLQKNEQFEVQISRKKIDIQDLEKKNSYIHIQNIQMVSKPIATKKPVKPKRKMMIILSAMVGCFLGLIVVLIREYVSFDAICKQPMKVRK